ncbi:DUF3613 domain-containing protein [Burkholderia mallei]|uniref:DUF3613 domain-containing protein n=1 Tax=Burkholderia mallei TaxID=13373 RepID=UPI00217CE5B3|nr:DUF3613 domain-containing protein [Burkholderia mallei]
MTTHDLTQTAAPRAGRGRALCAAALALALACAVGAARAQSPQRDAPSASEIGHATQTWFALQASNREAAPAQPMIGEAAGYRHAILTACLLYTSHAAADYRGVELERRRIIKKETKPQSRHTIIPVTLCLLPYYAA